MNEPELIPSPIENFEQNIIAKYGNKPEVKVEPEAVVEPVVEAPNPALTLPVEEKPLIPVEKELDLKEVPDYSKLNDFIDNETSLIGEVEEIKPGTPEAVQHEIENPLLADPMIKAMVEYRKNGGTDPADFVEKLGIINVNRLSPEQLFRMQAEDLGIPNDELDATVSEELELFASKGALERQEKLKQLRDKFGVRQQEKVNKFSMKRSDEDIRVSQIVKTSQDSLNSKVNSLVGQKILGLLTIDESKAEQIRSIAMTSAAEIIDTSGKLIGYNISGAIENATKSVFFNKAVAEARKSGKAEGYAEAMNERNRPAEDVTPSGGAIPKTDTYAVARKELSKQMGN